LLADRRTRYSVADQGGMGMHQCEKGFAVTWVMGGRVVWENYSERRDNNLMLACASVTITSKSALEKA